MSSEVAAPERARSRAQRDAAVPASGEWATAMLLIALPMASILLAYQVLGLHWALPALITATIMVAIGAAVRGAGRGSLYSRSLAWWLQALALAAALLARHLMIGDWEPGSSTQALWELLASFGRSIGEGAWHIAWYSELPYPQRDSIDTVVTLAAGVLVLLNDLVIRVMRAPAVAVLWLFLPLALPLAVRVHVSPLLVVPVAALFLTALLLGSRPRHGDARRRSGIGIIAAAVALAVALPFALPNPQEVASRIPQEVRDAGPAWFAPPAPMLSESIDLASNLRRGEAVDILRYRTSGSKGVRLRLTTLGDTSQGGFTELPRDAASALATPEDLQELMRPWGMPFDYSVESLGFTTPSLPVPAEPLRIIADTGLLEGFDAVNERAVIAEGNETLEATHTWGGTAAELPSPQAVLGLGDLGLHFPFFDAGGEPLLANEPDSLPAELADLRPIAQAIVGDAETDLEMMQLLTEWFQDDDWQYSEEIPFAGFGSEVDGQWDALLRFIEERVGYCVHYASALAALALALGIPSRVAVGFLPGRLAPEGWRVIDTNDMHAWTEVYINGFGWAAYDVTPPIAQGLRQASDVGENPYGPNGLAPTPRVTGDASAAPSASPSEPEELETDDALDPNAQSSAPRASDASASASPSGDAADGSSRIDATWLLAALGVVLLIMLPALIRTLQRGLRRRRGAIGAWHEIIATAVDAGVRLPDGLTAAQTAEALRRRTAGDAAAAIERVRLAAEGASFGRPDAPVPPYDPAAVAEVEQALWQGVGQLDALRRHWLPPSLVPQRIRSVLQR